MPASGIKPWLIAIDTGGTFTDCLGISPEGVFHSCKILSSARLRGIGTEVSGTEITLQQSWNAPDDFPVGFELRTLRGVTWGTVTSFDAKRSLVKIDRPIPTSTNLPVDLELISPWEAPTLGVHLLTGTPSGSALPPVILRLGTTKGTNALLERKGSPPTLYITKGFGDLLRIGNQARPDLFALEIHQPEPLTGKVEEVEERLTAEGKVLQPLNVDSISPGDGDEPVAIALLHADVNPQHELELESALLAKGTRSISRSSKVAPFVRLLDRARTTVINAYLSPLLNQYVGRVLNEVDPKQFLMMTSTGGLMRHDHFLPKDGLLSGPAGGVVGTLKEATTAGYSNAIGFDMGGTSTDVCRITNGVLPNRSEHQVGDALLLAPALEIHTVAAGGGSICRVVAGRLFVGPESAGSLPGPACYGAGGPLTITDVNLLLGRILPNSFEIPIRVDSAEAALQKELRHLNEQSSTMLSREELLEGFLQLANQTMANAIRRISIQQGYDPRNFALISFGGAGGQHACALAEELGMGTVIIPELASLLSAQGILQAAEEELVTQQVYRTLGELQLDSLFQNLEANGYARFEERGITGSAVRCVERWLEIRLKGQHESLRVDYHSTDSVPSQFHDLYVKRYGYEPPNRELEVTIVSALLSVQSAQDLSPQRIQSQTEKLVGPLLWEGLQTVVWIPENWMGQVNQNGQLILSHQPKGDTP